MNLKIDSRKVRRGDTFLALRGITQDGHQFINEAIEKGASLIIAEEGSYEVDTVIVKNTRAYLEAYLEAHYQEEISSLKLIGVTGTNGKTTSCFLLYEAIQKLAKKCAYIGTIGFYIEGKEKDLQNTTPDLLDLYEMLLEAKNQGCEYVVMEVSSHALAMGRVNTLLFDYAIFTNLTRDHLDYHDTMENYAQAKQILFKKLKKQGKAIINVDDPYCEKFILSDNKTITYGVKESDYQIKSMKVTSAENIFTIHHKDQEYLFESELIGKYNVYNMLCCIIVLMEEKFEVKSSMIKALKAPVGRMEKIKHKENTIIVDYAHTPDAVENILKSMKEIAEGRIYALVGCGGNRDKKKRPMMASIATTYADHAIFTSDNPRWEKPEDILEDMTKDLKKDNYEVIVNRKEAIKKGMQLLRKNDILLLLGKGHENYQIINGEKNHFDDKEIVLENI